VHTASSQLLAAAKSLAAGAAKRKLQGKPTYLIHVQSLYILDYIFVLTSCSPTYQTSGTSVVADRANGQYLGKEIYADTDDIYALEKSDASYNMRTVDTALVEAGEKGGFGVGIIVPPTICEY
jgi:hypothetical protein